MILVVGGMASGKRSYVESLGYAAADFSSRLDDAAPVVYGLEDLLREGPLADEDFESLCAKDVVVCREVGAGVVPLDAGERAWRERVGRTTNRLAECASSVVRMVCGIPVDLK